MTPQQARNAVRWAKKTLGITDWTIRTSLRDAKPRWAEDLNTNEAACEFNTATKHAKIWLSLDKCEEKRLNAAETLFHETAHIFLADTLTLNNQPDDPLEFACNRIAAIMRQAYEAQK